jgi:hypothetical protein
MQQFQLDGLAEEKLLINLRADFNEKVLAEQEERFNA